MKAENIWRSSVHWEKITVYLRLYTDYKEWRWTKNHPGRHNLNKFTLIIQGGGGVKIADPGPSLEIHKIKLWAKSQATVDYIKINYVT